MRTPETPFAGPTFQGAWRVYWMTDWHDEGAVNAFDVSIFPLRGPFRLGGSLEAGLRNEATDDDLVLRAYANLGWQRPGRVTPYVVATIGLGTIAQTRFGITDWAVLGSFGLDAGAEVRLGTSFRMGASLGLLRVLARDTRFDSVSIRLSLGF